MVCFNLAANLDTCRRVSSFEWLPTTDGGSEFTQIYFPIPVNRE